MGIPIPILYLIALIVFIAVLFIVFKRPMYEIMILAFVFTIVMTWRFDLFWSSLLYPSTSSLFYAIFAFMVVAVLFDATKVVDKIINLMLSLVGRFRGGAGYVSLLGSTFMASLSGTGPGNVAATGVFTIPTMKKAGYPSRLAATIEMSASMLGNIIPPSGIVFLTYGILEEIHPGSITLSSWVLAAYGIGLWFFLQRWLTIWGLCKWYKVKPIIRQDIPNFSHSFKVGWPALILPALIFIPLFADAQLKDAIIGRIGQDGADAFSSSVLMFTPGFAAAYAIGIGRKSMFETKKRFQQLMNVFKESLSKVVPIAVTIYMAYATATVFGAIEMNEVIKDWFLSIGMSVPIMIIVLPLFFMVLGMVLPGSAQIAILGGAVITAFGALGGDATLFAAMLPAMTGALEGMTPPLALGLFVAMGIAGSGFKETSKLTIIWVVLHVALSMILLTGILPILGL